jgi:hypothetical protein
VKPAHALPDVAAVPASPDAGDSRDSAQDTKKITREELEAVLKRTRSGTRRAVRAEPASDRHSAEGQPLEGPAPAGPFDDCSPSSIERIARIEFEIDPASLSTPPPEPAPVLSGIVPTLLPASRPASQPSIRPSIRPASLPPEAPSSASTSLDALTATPARPLASVIMLTLARVASAIKAFARRIFAR